MVFSIRMMAAFTLPIPRDGSRPTNFIYYTDSRDAITTFLDDHVELLEPPIEDRLFE